MDSDEASEKHTKLGEPPEDGDLLVVDPDDYQKTQRLKSIHQTRDYVQEIRQQKFDNTGLYDEFDREWYRTYHNHLSQAVASYGNELWPLVEKGLEHSILESDDLVANVPTSDDDISIKLFIDFEGAIKDGGEIKTDPNPTVSMAVYRQLDRIMSKLGLGLEIQEQKGPAQI